MCDLDRLRERFYDFLSQSINQHKSLVIGVIRDSYVSVNQRGRLNERSHVIPTHFSCTP